MGRRSYAGGANTVPLSNPISAGAGSLLAGATPLGWPDGSGGPFAIVVNKGAATEEKMLVSARTGAAFAISIRGYDGTLPQSHSNPENIQMCVTGIDLDEANAHVNAALGVHGLSSLDHIAGVDAVQTLTNKTIDGASNTFLNIPRLASPQIDSKLTALDAANATQDAAIAAKVPLAGGTMTGLLLLSADPAAALGAVTKQYVDAGQSSDAASLALKAPIASPTFTGTVTLAGNPTLALQAVTKQYADALIAGKFEWGVSNLTPDVNGNVNIPHGSYTPVALIMSVVGPNPGNWAGVFIPAVRALGNPSTVRCFHTTDGTPVGSGGVTIHWIAVKP